MVRFPHLLREQLIMEGDEMIQNGLLAFHEKTGCQRIAFSRGKPPQGAGIRPLGQVGTVSQHRRT